MTLITTIQEHDERDNNEATDRVSGRPNPLAKVAKAGTGSAATGDADRDILDQSSVDDSGDISSIEIQSFVPDHGSGLRKQHQNNSSIQPHGRSSELPRTVVLEEREQRGHNDHGEQRGRSTERKRISDRGGRSDVRADRRVLAPRKQVEEFDSFRVDPKDISRWWPLVRSGIDYVIEKTKAPFIAEDVYAYCVKDEAWLIVTYTKKGDYAGCVVVAQAALNNFATKPEMLIWVAYSKVPGAAESTLAKVEIVAKSLGFGYIVFHSPRAGWKRRAKHLGFTLRERVYEKKLD